MITVALAACMAEAVVLGGVVVVLVRLHLRFKALSHRADGALAQMQDWVLEAEQLSATLLDQLHERPRQAAAPASAAGSGVVLQFAEAVERAGDQHADTLPPARPAARPLEDQMADRRLAREKSMDPAGVALQRLLGRDSGIA